MKLHAALSGTKRAIVATQLFHLLMIASIALHSKEALGLSEDFPIYNAPQAHSLGFAVTALAKGILATHYNPAGLAQETKRRVEVSLLDTNSVFGMGGLGAIIASRTVSTPKVTNLIQNLPNTYAFYQFNVGASISTRFLSFAPLFNYRYAAVSDGTSVDMNTVYDFVLPLSFSTHVYGNRLKLGVTAKTIVRNELQGVFPHAQLQSDANVATLSKEGMGFGADAGLIYTFPKRLLPTLAVVWKDILGTQFVSSSGWLMGGQAGLPSTIPQAIHVAGALFPNFGKRLKGAILVEYKNVQDTTLAFDKKLHLGFQLEDEKRFYFWMGLNKYYLSVGFALRLPGGNLEISTYGDEATSGSVTYGDRRFALRYTIGF